MITTISDSKNPVLKKFAQMANENNVSLVIIGDVKTPDNFDLKGGNYYSLAHQKTLDFNLCNDLPENHYARKNIGYLIAMSNGADIIIDTDDDNEPYSSFWLKKNRFITLPVVEDKGWLNVYDFFTDINIWPRGFPLNKLHKTITPFEKLLSKKINTPIQQGLADGDPDVDAIFRLVINKLITFSKDRRVALSKGVWCPFNSQNTTWWKDTFPLLYLPSNCSFRMTDIWRSFIAQRIAWENDWNISFHAPTTYQNRNEHELMKDFKDEIPGYLNNEKICYELENLTLMKGMENIYGNIRTCYEKLLELEIIPDIELTLVEQWIDDCKQIL